MEMPKAGPGHKKMDLLAGRWEGEETMHPSQWDPKSGTALGRTTSDPERLATRMEMSQDGATWNTLFDGRYRRI
jgi:hypothetical protein